MKLKKAHPDVYNILLQVLDDGQLTDGLGTQGGFQEFADHYDIKYWCPPVERTLARALDLRHRHVRISPTSIQKQSFRNALKRTFSPEFLNRIDDVVIFNSLDQDHIHQIIDITLKELYARLGNLNYALKLTSEAKDFVAEKGFDPQFGARPLHRAIQKYIEDPLAEFILSENPTENAELLASLNEEKDGLVISFAEVNTDVKES